MDHVQPVEQILAKLSLRDQILQDAIGGRDDARVVGDRHAVGADGLNLARFQVAQQQTLHVQGHLADFVEEDRAVARRLEFSGFITVGPRETPLDVTEQFRLEQRFWNAGAVHRYEGRVGAGARRADGAGDDLFAHAALARDQHFAVGAGNVGDFFPQLRNHTTRAE